MTTFDQFDPHNVPAGWLGIVSQNRAVPVAKIVDVQGQLAGGTHIYLEGGREVHVRADMDAVLAAIDEATWGHGIPVLVDDDEADAPEPRTSVPA